MLSLVGFFAILIPLVIFTGGMLFASFIPQPFGSRLCIIPFSIGALLIFYLIKYSGITISIGGI